MVAGLLNKLKALQYPDRFYAESERLRHRVDGGPPRDSVAALHPRRDRANLHRIKDSHRGIGGFTHLRHLVAGAVNQDYLDEIGALTELIELDLQWPMRAGDLSPLTNLKKLEVLNMIGPTKVEDWSPLYTLPKLRVLTVEAPRKEAGLEWAEPLFDRLEVFGLEGSIPTNYTIDTLELLRGAAIKAFFCASLTVKSKDLSPLHDCPNLELLSGGVLAPWREYEALHKARPDLLCQWFDPTKWQPRWRGAPGEAEREAFRAKAKGEGH